MLKGVVQRYAPNVMMTKVEKINIGRAAEKCMSAVMPVFEKACRYIASHSQPLETQGIRPTLDELKADFDGSAQGSGAAQGIAFASASSISLYGVGRHVPLHTRPRAPLGVSSPNAILGASPPRRPILSCLRARQLR